MVVDANINDGITSKAARSAAACTLARLGHLLTTGNGDARQAKAEATAGTYFLRLADRRIGRNFEALKDNDDALTTAAADAALNAN